MQILTSSWVLPVHRPPLRDGRVAVRDGRVAWVGRAGEAGEPAGPVRDLGPGVLTPALINAHTHLELTHLRDLREAGLAFVPWIEALVSRREQETAEQVQAALEAGKADLEATVAVGDVSNKLAHLDWLEGSGLSAVVFHELLGWDPARAEGLLSAADAEAAGRRDRLRVRVRPAAHGPHSNSPDLLRGLVARGGPAAIHLAESPVESEFLSRGDGEWGAFLARRGLGHVAFRPSGLSPVRYLDSLGVLQHGLVAAHCVHVDEADAALLALRGVHAVICLTSNRALGVGRAPLSRLLHAGVLLALGTDSAASGAGIDVHQELVEVAREYAEVEPSILLWMATEGGALALGFSDLGNLSPARRAEMLHFATGSVPRDPWEVVMGGGVRPTRLRS